MLIDGLSGMPVALGFWNRNEKPEDVQVKLLQTMADRLGYRISKRPEKK